MADLITGNTQLGPTKQDIIAAIVQKELAFNAKLSGTVTDVSQFAGPGMKSISFPKLSSFTVINRASGVAGDASQLTSAVDTLDLDYNAYVAWIIDSSDEIQSNIQSQIAFAQRAAAAQGRYVDTQIIGELETVGVATTTAGTITRDIVLEMRTSYLQNDGILDEAVWLVSVFQEEALLKVSQFESADVYGSAVIPSGVIGRLYGVPVMIHNGLADAQYFLYGKSGMALGFQKAPSMSQQGANEYGTAAVRVAMDQLFGVSGLELGEKGVAATESPLVIKDNN